MDGVSSADRTGRIHRKAEQLELLSFWRLEQQGNRREERWCPLQNDLLKEMEDDFLEEIEKAYLLAMQRHQTD